MLSKESKSTALTSQNTCNLLVLKHAYSVTFSNTIEILFHKHRQYPPIQFEQLILSCIESILRQLLFTDRVSIIKNPVQKSPIFSY